MEKKKHRCARARTMGLFLLCLFFAALGLWQLGVLRAETPDAVWVHNPEGLTPSYTEAKNVYDARSISYGFAAAPMQADAQFAGGAVQAKITGANAGWAGYAGLEILSGEWYSQDAVMEGQRLAAVPYTLALQVFAGTDIPADAYFTLENEQYRVCAVYKDGGGLIAGAAAGTLPEICVSNLPAGDYARPLHQMLLLGDGGAGSLLRLASSRFNSTLGGEVKDLRQTVSLGGQICYLFVLVCAALPLVWLARYGINSLVALYMDGSLLTKKGMLRLARGVLCIAGMLAALYFLLGGVAVPNKYLPAGSILNLAHYPRQIYAYYQARATSGYVESLEARLTLRLWAVTACGAGAAVFFYRGMFRLRRGLPGGRVDKRQRF